MVVKDFSRWILICFNIKKQKDFDEADEEELKRNGCVWTTLQRELFLTKVNNRDNNIGY